MSMVIDIVFFDGSDWAVAGRCEPLWAFYWPKGGRLGVFRQRTAEKPARDRGGGPLQAKRFLNHFTSEDALVALVMEKQWKKGGRLSPASRSRANSAVHNAVIQRHAGIAYAAAFRGT